MTMPHKSKNDRDILSSKIQNQAKSQKDCCILNWKLPNPIKIQNDYGILNGEILWIFVKTWIFVKNGFFWQNWNFCHMEKLVHPYQPFYAFLCKAAVLRNYHFHKKSRKITIFIKNHESSRQNMKTNHMTSLKNLEKSLWNSETTGP